MLPGPLQGFEGDHFRLFTGDQNCNLIVITHFNSTRIESTVVTDRQRWGNSRIFKKQEEFFEIMGTPEHNLSHGQYSFQCFFHGLLCMELGRSKISILMSGEDGKCPVVPFRQSEEP